MGERRPEFSPWFSLGGPNGNLLTKNFFLHFKKKSQVIASMVSDRCIHSSLFSSNESVVRFEQIQFHALKVAERVGTSIAQ